MKNYTFKLAKKEETKEIFNLYAERVRWMNKHGIRQWNTTGYLERYPLSYFQEQCELGNLYVLRSIEDGSIASAVVLYQSDERWLDKADVPAYYIHNLVAHPDAKGAGARMIAAAEKNAIEHGKHFIRLDCAVDNTFLNQYYASKGYVEAGKCKDGSYLGIRREKKLL